MCLIFFAYDQHPRYKLIVGANRDENYQRPTRGARFWNSHPNILAGKDLEAGGTWMGITRSGRFSAVTNYRDPNILKKDPPSRGHLVLDFLKQSESPEVYLEHVDQKADRYDGFNLLVGTPADLYYYSNQQKAIQRLSPGIYGLSNHLLNTPWPKVKRARSQLRHIIQQPSISETALFDLLSDDVEAPENQLPDTGIPKEVERMISPVFIKSENYGTRCSTILLIDRNNKVTFKERRFKAGTQEIKEKNKFEFSLTPDQ